jgi:hypothetical protein
MTWHRVVFRAKAREALLAISDAQAAAPGSETAFNFIELQPFHPPRRP